MGKQKNHQPISFSGGVKSISDDDLCAKCKHLNYEPGGMSACKMYFPGYEDEDGYVVFCESFKSK